MNIIDVTVENYKSVLEENEIVLFHFWSPESEECSVFAPVLEAIAQDHTDIIFAKVNMKKHEEVGGKFAIREIPTVAMSKQGVLIYKEPVTLPKKDLEDVIRQVRELNMLAVHQEVANMEKKKD